MEKSLETIIKVRSFFVIIFSILLGVNSVAMIIPIYGTNIEIDLPCKMVYQRKLNMFVSEDQSITIHNSRFDIPLSVYISSIKSSSSYEPVMINSKFSVYKNKIEQADYKMYSIISGTDECTFLIQFLMKESSEKAIFPFFKTARIREIEPNEIRSIMFFNLELEKKWSLRGWIGSQYIYTLNNHTIAGATTLLKIGSNFLSSSTSGKEEAILLYMSDPENSEIKRNIKTKTLKHHNSSIYQIEYEYYQKGIKLNKYMFAIFQDQIVYYFELTTNESIYEEYIKYLHQFMIKE